MMRVKYSVSDLNELYERLVHKAHKYWEKSLYDKCISCIEDAAYFQYCLNNIYSDQRLDTLLQKISQVYFHNARPYIGSDTVFFYDSFCLDNRGLTQHYLDALMNNGKYRIIYICEKRSAPRGRDIIEMLKNNRIDYYFLPDVSWKEKCDFLHGLINKYTPKAVLFHLTPFTAIPFIAFGPFLQIIKYQINLTDHAFWLGGNFFDYLYEFRTYGISVSIEKRGYNESQLILNPFYPWQSGEPFQGFPVSIEGKVVIFSGGALYKIEGENDKYFNLVKNILNTYPNVIFFYAGNGDETHIRSFIKANFFENRLILLGNRSDIDAVFRNCDIYMSTYPLGGGLMSQYAAINSKPILVYKSVDIEKLACTKQYIPYALNSTKEFIEEVGLLVNDEEYRKKKGVLSKSLIIEQDTFRSRFNVTFMKSEISSDSYSSELIDYQNFCMGYVDKINNNTFGFIENRLIRNFIISHKVIINAFFYIPQYVVKFLQRKSGLLRSSL